MSRLKNHLKEDLFIDNLLRPTSWDNYIGQEKIKRNLRILLSAAEKRGEQSEHLLFYGQAGLGKTTLAYLIAKEMGCEIRVASGPTLEKTGDLVAILSNLEEGEVLFIDEAHRLNRAIEEVLYPAMESRKMHIVVGRGPGARTITLDLPPFTLIAATTRVNLLSQPLRSRFGATFRLDYYEVGDIEEIVRRSAEILKAQIDEGAVGIVARASRFTPRIANRLLKRVRDFVEVNNLKSINEEAARKTLELLEIDQLGLEAHDRRLLELMITKFAGGPVGVNTLAAALGEEKGVIEDVYEPYLMKLGFLERKPAGRIVTEAAREHIKTTG